jgi:hypothetical protein
VAAKASREPAPIDRRPASGGGSCARCRASLGLASLKQDGVWYCSSACAEGRGAASPRAARVPEPWLYARPQRFFHKRMPKELRSTRSGS